MKTSWLFVILLFSGLTIFSQNHPPVAVNDTTTGLVGQTLIITSSFLLKNDYDPDGDNITVSNTTGLHKVNDTTWDKVFYPDMSITSTSVSYRIMDEHGVYSPWRSLLIKLKGSVRFDTLNINNISAIINPLGQHFSNFEDSHFEVPKKSGMQATILHTLWLAGLNDTNKVCGISDLRFGNNPISNYYKSNFSVGPITNTFDLNYYIKWNRVWKIDKDQIRFHINNWDKPGYKPIEVIENWPGNGDVSMGQSQNIAPFYDRDSDGFYEPLQGDYPLIKGNQAVFFIYNDTPKNEYDLKNSMGIEIHGMAYGYDLPNDSVLKNTLFMHYEFVNRRINNYHEVYIGLFTYLGLGNPSDDYVGCDVTNGMIYSYNGDNFDETVITGSGPPLIGYGTHPPALGLKVIGGPYLQPDGIDNPVGDCNLSLNGLNFGDQITDNERLGLTGFMSYKRCSTIVPTGTTPDKMCPFGDPINLHNNAQGIWSDGSPMIYADSIGPDCHFMYPGNSDTVCNYGTNGIPPNGGFNQNGHFWTEYTVGHSPGNRLGVATVGPVNLNAGETLPLDYCFTFARDYNGNNLSSVELLRQRIASLSSSWNTLINTPVSLYGIPENKQETSVNVFPNPVHDKLIIVSESNSEIPYILCAVSGIVLSQGYIHPGKNTLDVSGIKPGIYILKSGEHTSRVVKI